MILWNSKPVFWWYRDEIRCSNPDAQQVIKMVHMAKVLGAKTVGDDGEHYKLTKTASGVEELVTVYL